MLVCSGYIVPRATAFKKQYGLSPCDEALRYLLLCSFFPYNKYYLERLLQNFSFATATVKKCSFAARRAKKLQEPVHRTEGSQ
jgi:hypothetical protein